MVQFVNWSESVGESDDIVPRGVRSEVHGRVCSHMKLHAIEEHVRCILPELVRIPSLVRHEVGMIRFVVGLCPGRRCHVIQLLNSLNIDHSYAKRLTACDTKISGLFCVIV